MDAAVVSDHLARQAEIVTRRCSVKVAIPAVLGETLLALLQLLDILPLFFSSDDGTTNAGTPFCV